MEYIQCKIFYKVQNQIMYHLGMHTDVEDHRGNDKMNDKIDKLKKKTQNTRITLAGVEG